MRKFTNCRSWDSMTGLWDSATHSILVCERNLPFKVSNQLTRTFVKRHNFSIRFRIAPVGVGFSKVLIASPDRVRLGADARLNAVGKQACVGMAAAGRF
jgi:hypothetical protein